MQSCRSAVNRIYVWNTPTPTPPLHLLFRINWIILPLWINTTIAPPVLDQPDNSAEGTSTSTNILNQLNPTTQVMLQDSDALFSLRQYSKGYDADKESEEEEVVKETVLLTSMQQDDQNAPSV